MLPCLLVAFQRAQSSNSVLPMTSVVNHRTCEIIAETEICGFLVVTQSTLSSVVHNTVTRVQT